MSTPRAEAIRFSGQLHQDPRELCPISFASADLKIQHYAVLGALLHEAGDKSLADLEHFDTSEIHTQSGLRHALTQRLLVSLLNPHHPAAAADKAMIADLLFSRHGAVGRPDTIVRDSIYAGASTALHTMETTYDLIESEYGEKTAQHPENSTIVSRLARLSVNQFEALRETYLDREENLQLLLPTIEVGAPEGPVRFKKGYPLGIAVPEAVTCKRKLKYIDDATIQEDTTMVILKDIEEDNPIIGCPISFQPRTIHELWRIYVAKRSAL